MTCDDASAATPASLAAARSLLLTLSNLAFLPAVLIAAYYRMYGEALVYFATMVSSTFYHTCDQVCCSIYCPQSQG